MKRVQEKIKDLVDARPYEAVKNYATDVEQTVAAYRFTDATADLLAKWFDEIGRLAHGDSTGAAFALAGNRGAGKSHLLAVLAAVTENAELRSRLADSHVAASAQSLPRRRLKVVRVERGTAPTFSEEFRNALSKTFGAAADNFGANPAQMLDVAAHQPETDPLVLIVDSAQTRASRVKRDDGAVLSELAEIAKHTRVFLAVALDDDISGADGVNASIARSFQINFLDQEHLYRILDAHIFPKRLTARPILREVYQMLREEMPGFNWSEPRFTTLYPVHPIVAEVVPAVRLYAQNFAFLPFAAESGRMTLNRPAHSLIALDEIFDRAESELRKSEELSDNFAVYDHLSNEAMPKIAVLQRLQAKLILKALFILSLDGRGASAREIASAMLITDENAPGATLSRVEEMLSVFAATNENLRVREESGERIYRFGKDAGSDFEAKLNELAAQISPAEIKRILRRAGESRFNDWIFGSESETEADFIVRWRGTLRRGRVLWEKADAEKTENLDWEIIVSFDSELRSDAGEADVPRLVWRPAPLRAEDDQILRRFAVLQGQIGIGEEHEEAAVAAAQTYAALAERVWTRVFVDDGVLVLAGEKHQSTPEMTRATTLEDFLQAALTPIFDRKFGAHPHFRELLTASEVSTLVSEFFGTSGANSPQAQKLAKDFAAPLGLATENTPTALESDERLLRQPLIRRVWNAVEQAGERVVPLTEIYAELKSEPYGLSREAQHLVLAALVARRRVELVARAGERITRRFLDLRIIWSEINGIVRSAVLPRSSAELINWARHLTGAQIEAASLHDTLSAANLNQALTNWLADWRKEQVLKRFEALPDDALNVRAWKLATRATKTFGVAAEAVADALDGKILLEDALERVAEAFNDDAQQIAAGQRELESLKTFVVAVPAREAIWRYVALAEATGDAEIEALRERILDFLERHETAFDRQAEEHLNRFWQEFQERYAAFYQSRHNQIVRSAERQPQLEKLFQSHEWAEFVELSEIGIFHPRFRAEAEKLRRRAELLKCEFDVGTLLREHPACACGFRMIETDLLERLPEELQRTVIEGLTAYRQTLAGFEKSFAVALEDAAQNAVNAEIALAAAKLSDYFMRGEDLPPLEHADIEAVKQALSEMQNTQLAIAAPRADGLVFTREDLRLRFNNWLDRLPDAPFLVKLTDGEN
ncbi:MAG: DUF6079 family protein [Acidobacteriota bacterium]|nr:DUF6079 family protein [Acidobacteriota bacterium]